MYCHKLKKQATALKNQPFPGPLGERILKEISQQAWNMWLEKQTILINEQRLDMTNPETRKYLLQQMQRFLFEDA